ncbi:hypothetical protein BDW02DRAFT_506768 [Decorospora gaudefroyi]|uniref:Killer toxin Kp4 domain-containing protein n=1 Tax=Decorospora gaudefroyi TaxID=184978 RepID=A0A6A5K0F7_9PLEO|nr:hypothetical protein BDW02DRAFT_506768 [Decorospora gaudefroyi]
MKPTNLLLASLVTIGVSADWCKDRWVYCGRSLLNKGNYLEDIRHALQKAGESGDDAHVTDSLFYCNGRKDINGIDFIKFCGRSECRNRGILRDDNCDD